jgi:RNA polymerase sigma-70 factor, ECF subfamily
MTALEQAWEAHRRVALDVAYRLLGSLTDAEDAVSEAYARLARRPVDEIGDVRGWLVVVVSRICLDQLGSARAKREQYVGEWLPEPILDSDPADRVTLDDSVRMALLVVLERLSPAERVAFVLHDVFALSFEEVADAVGRTPAACRQLASRARRHVQADGLARFPVDRAEEAAVTARFAAACETGDLAALAELLDPDVVFRADGGGRVQAPRRPVQGRDTVLKIMANGYRRFPGLQISVGNVNGGPGLVARAPDGTLVSVGALAIRDGRVREIDLVANPEKLPRPYGPPA